MFFYERVHHFLAYSCCFTMTSTSLPKWRADALLFFFFFQIKAHFKWKQADIFSTSFLLWLISACASRVGRGLCFLLLVKYSLHFHPSGLKADTQTATPPQSTNKSEVKRSPSPPSLHFSHTDSPDDCFYVRTEARIRTWEKKWQIPPIDGYDL